MTAPEYQTGPVPAESTAVATVCGACQRAIMQRGLPAGYKGEVCLCPSTPPRAEPASEAS